MSCVHPTDRKYLEMMDAIKREFLVNVCRNGVAWPFIVECDGDGWILV